MEERFSATILCDTRSEADNNGRKVQTCCGNKNEYKEGLALLRKTLLLIALAMSLKQMKGDDLQKIIEKSSRFNPAGVKGSLLAMLSRSDTRRAWERLYSDSAHLPVRRMH